jgi:hypothetical protein
LKCLVASAWPFNPSKWPFNHESPCPIPDDVLWGWLEEREDGTAKLAHYLWEFAAATGLEGVQLQQDSFQEVVRSLSNPDDRKVKWISVRMTMWRAGRTQALSVNRDDFVAKAEEDLVCIHYFKRDCISADQVSGKTLVANSCIQG